jgi:hypothetical protein
MTKCAHDACHCQGNEVQADGYCSPSCREGKTENGRCACGHPDCR